MRAEPVWDNSVEKVRRIYKLLLPKTEHQAQLTPRFPAWQRNLHAFEKLNIKPQPIPP